MRVKPIPSPSTPNPTTRILSHPGGVWLTLRSLPQRGGRLSLSVRPANPSGSPRSGHWASVCLLSGVKRTKIDGPQNFRS